MTAAARVTNSSSEPAAAPAGGAAPYAIDARDLRSYARLLTYRADRERRAGGVGIILDLGAVGSLVRLLEAGAAAMEGGAAGASPTP